MATHGNLKVNSDLEFHVPSEFWKPDADEPRETRQRYIEAKYRDRLFSKETAPLSDAITEVLPDGSTVLTQSPVRRPATLRPESSRHSALASKKPLGRKSQGMILYDGVLAVNLLRGEHLKPSEISTALSTSYCSVQVGARKEHSTVVKNVENPVWGESFTFCFQQGNVLNVQIMNRHFLFQENVGGCVVNLQRFPAERSIALMIPVLSRSKSKVLELFWQDLVCDEDDRKLELSAPVSTGVWGKILQIFPGLKGSNRGHIKVVLKYSSLAT